MAFLWAKQTGHFLLCSSSALWVWGFKYYFISRVLDKNQNFWGMKMLFKYILMFFRLSLNMSEMWDHYISPWCNTFHTQCAGGQNWHIFSPTPSVITMSKSFLHVCTFCISQSSSAVSMSVLFSRSFSHHTQIKNSHPCEGVAPCFAQPQYINVNLWTSIKLCKAHSSHRDVVYTSAGA